MLRNKTLAESSIRVKIIPGYKIPLSTTVQEKLVFNLIRSLKHKVLDKVHERVIEIEK